jgi:hypothetical protein
MAAPTPASSRGTPVGIKLPDGFSTEIVFTPASGGGGTAISFWEKTVQPLKYEIGEIDQTTMLNVLYRTYRGSALFENGEVTGNCAYSPRIIAQLPSVMGRSKEGTITVIFPDTSSVCAYACFTKFEPEALEEKKQPMAKYTFRITNYDPTNGVEAGPVFTPPSGTGTD